MKRTTTKTIRIDMESHRVLSDLAKQFSKCKGQKYSIADVVRVGITLAARHVSKANRTIAINPSNQDE